MYNAENMIPRTPEGLVDLRATPNPNATAQPPAADTIGTKVMNEGISEDTRRWVNRSKNRLPAIVPAAVEPTTANGPNSNSDVVKKMLHSIEAIPYRASIPGLPMT